MLLLFFLLLFLGGAIAKLKFCQPIFIEAFQGILCFITFARPTPLCSLRVGGGGLRWAGVIYPLCKMMPWTSESGCTLTSYPPQSSLHMCPLSPPPSVTQCCAVGKKPSFLSCLKKCDFCSISSSWRKTRATGWHRPYYNKPNFLQHSQRPSAVK